MKRVAVVDYGLCNLDSVRRAFEECGASPYVTDDPADLRRADAIVLPGVGSFSDAMANLRAKGLDRALTDEVVEGGAPFLGICLGMQLVATTGDEGGRTAGLGWVGASVERLQPTATDRHVPHVGWNEVDATADAQLFDGLPDGADFYFVHSFHVRCDDPASIAAVTPYCGGFTSAIEQGNVFGVQFHPEKSQVHGFRVITNFLAV